RSMSDLSRPTTEHAPTVIGSDRDLGALAAALAAGRSTVVQGPLGAGKSFLLRALTHRLTTLGVDPVVVHAPSPLVHTSLGALCTTDHERIRSATSTMPLTVLVDDAHNLDEESLRLLVLGVANRTCRVL